MKNATERAPKNTENKTSVFSGIADKYGSKSFVPNGTAIGGLTFQEIVAGGKAFNSRWYFDV